MSAVERVQAPHLSVNVDHVATVRQARRAVYPDPVEAARLAEDAGASGITVHLREDRRHIQEDDVIRLRATMRGKLNLEMGATEAMVRTAQRLAPHQVTLVPERPDEITTVGGLDLVSHSSRIQRVATTLHQSGISVSLFLDPDPRQLACLGSMTNLVGAEINTDSYTRAGSELERKRELAAVTAAARLIEAAGLRVFAGHGLDPRNVAAIAVVPGMEELNIGHAIVARAVIVGMTVAVGEMLAALRRW